MIRKIWKWWLLIIIVLIIGVVISSFFGEDETVSNPEVAQGDEKQEDQLEDRNEGSWINQIKSTANSDETETEKHDKVYYLAKDYAATISDKELAEFENYIIDEFTTGKYLDDITNHEYMLENVFKSVVVEKSIEDEQDPVKNFAFDYYQNIKYTYRGVDAVDSESVKSNEEQMNKTLSEIK